jgi:hypothetical protein
VTRCLLVAALLLTACTGDGGGDDDTGPVALCRAQYLDREVAGAFATTVGDVRAKTAGRGFRPAATAWGDVPDNAAAAWCYVAYDGPDTGGTEVAAVTEGHAAVVFGRGQFTPSPYGPQIP